MDWFRSHHGAPTDHKWVVVAKRAGTVPGVVAAVWWALMDHASQNKDRGSIEGFDIEALAAFYGWEEETIAAVVHALRERGLIVNERLSAWETRQPRREDGSAERARAWRERKRAEENEDERNRTHANATERTRTQPNARTEQSREEKSREEREKNPPTHIPSPLESAADAAGGEVDIGPDFEAFWQAYPKRSGPNPKARALKAWRRRLREHVDPEDIMAGLARYRAYLEAAGKVGTEFVMQAATFLGPDRRWEDDFELPPPDDSATDEEREYEEWMRKTQAEMI